MERRRIEENRIDTIARFLLALHEDGEPIDPHPIVQLADALLVEEPGQPLRFAQASPLKTRAFLGSTEHAAPARFVCTNALNCACVLARVARSDAEWRERSREVVLAGLLHDVGMIGSRPGDSWTDRSAE